MKLFYNLCCISLLACHSLKPTQPVRQGLQGCVYQKMGNKIPMKGKPQQKGRGISRELYIYQPTTAAQAEGDNLIFYKIGTKLMAITRSDSTGCYRVALPAGKYSVFIKDKDVYYATETDDRGILNPVEIIKDSVVVKNWTLSKGATY